MKALSLALRILAIIAAIISAAAYFMAQGKLAEKEAQITQVQVEAQTNVADLDAANTEVARLKTEFAKISEESAKTKRDLDSVKSEAYTARQELTRTQQQLREEKSKKQEMEESNRRLKADLIKTEDGAVAASREGEIALLSERIRELESVNETLKQDVAAAKSRAKNLAAARQASTAPVVNSRNETTTGTPSPRSSLSLNKSPAEGSFSLGPQTTITSVDTGAAIVVLDIPADLELAIGQTLSLIQNLELIAKVEVTQLRKDLAITSILKAPKSNSLKPGATITILR